MQNTVLACALVGFAAAAHLALTPVFLGGPDAYPPIQDTSRLAFRRVPLELIVLPWFLVVATVSIASRFSDEHRRRRLSRETFVLAMLAISTVLMVVWDVGFRSNIAVQYEVCAAAIFAIFLSSGITQQSGFWEAFRSAPGDARHIVRTVPRWIGAGFLAMATIAILLPDRKPRTVSPEQVLAFFRTQPRHVLSGLTTGDARVAIVLFNNYQCPGCRTAEKYYSSVFAEFERSNPGQIKRIVLDFPQDAECNPFTKHRHDAACEAAVAVRLAREHNRENEMVQWLWTNQESLSSVTVRQAAGVIGGAHDFDTRYAAVLAEVTDDVRRGAALGVTGTPSYYLNGVRLWGILPRRHLSAIIRSELGLPADLSDRGFNELP